MWPRCKAGVALTPLQPELFWRGALPPCRLLGLAPRQTLQQPEADPEANQVAGEGLGVGHHREHLQ